MGENQNCLIAVGESLPYQIKKNFSGLDPGIRSQADR